MTDAAKPSTEPKKEGGAAPAPKPAAEKKDTKSSVKDEAGSKGSLDTAKPASSAALPSDAKITAAVARELKRGNEEDLTVRKMVNALNKEFNADLSAKKAFIKAEIYRLIAEEDDEDEEESSEESDDSSESDAKPAKAAPKTGEKRKTTPSKTKKAPAKKKAKTGAKGKGKGKGKAAKKKKPLTEKQAEKKKKQAEKRRVKAEKLQAVAPEAPREEKKIEPGSYWDTAVTGDRRAAVAAYNRMPQHWSVKYHEKKAAEKKAVANGDAPAKPAAPKNARKYLLAPALADFLGGPNLLPRQDVVRKLHAYFKEKNLKDPKDGRQFLLDEPTQALFKCKKVTYFTLNKKLTPLLKDPKDVV